jgi:phage terminase large subunit-like protein
MIEGESGILNCSPPWFKPEYMPSKKQLIWPNGAKAQIFYGSEPDKARGAQSDLIWADEVAKWQYQQDTFDNLLLGLRLGTSPLCGVSSTPKPTKFIKDLVARKDTIVTGGSTFDNFNNLAQTFIDVILEKYKGTRLERQEIYAQILDDNPNALWRRDWIDAFRVDKYPDLYRVIVAIDPAASHDEETSAENGIVIVGEGPAPDGKTDKKHYYVIDDMSLIATPDQWARQAIVGYHKYKADRIIAEKNQGGDMVEATLKNVNRDIRVKMVWASRGKVTRAEPISALYEQGRVHHVGTFGSLEDQMCEWQPDMPSPDRMDALVWGITSLMEDSGFNIRII